MTRRSSFRNRGQGRRNRGSANSSGAGGITTVKFHRLNTNTLSGVTGILTYTVNPQSGQLGALASVGDQFDLFRCTNLKYRLHPMDPAYTTQQAMAYIPDVDVQTATVSQLSESPSAVPQTAFSGVPSSWMRVPPSQLKGMLDWYKCQPDAGAAEFESQGVIYLAGGLGDSVTWEIRGTMQFKNPVSTVVMMERTLHRARDLGLCVLVDQTPSSAASKESHAALRTKVR